MIKISSKHYRVYSPIPKNKKSKVTMDQCRRRNSFTPKELKADDFGTKWELNAYATKTMIETIINCVLIDLAHSFEGLTATRNMYKNHRSIAEDTGCGIIITTNAETTKASSLNFYVEIIPAKQSVRAHNMKTAIEVRIKQTLDKFKKPAKSHAPDAVNSDKTSKAADKKQKKTTKVVSDEAPV